MGALASFRGIFAEHYESLPEMTAATAARVTTEEGEVFSPGVVVLATIDSVLPGRPLGDEPENAVETVNLVLHVSHVLAGDSPAEPLLNVEMLNPGGSGMTPAEFHAAISGDQGVFFLRNLGREAEELGLPAAKQAAEAPFWRKINSQGILLNDGGFGYAPMATGVGENGIPLFPASFNGQRFEDIVELVMLAAT